MDDNKNFYNGNNDGQIPENPNDLRAQYDQYNHPEAAPAENQADAQPVQEPVNPIVQQNPQDQVPQYDNSGYQPQQYNGNVYPEENYAPQQGYAPQNPYAQNQPQYNQNNYYQGGYPQNDYPQNGYPQNGYQQNGYQQNDYSQNGYAQNDYSQNYYGNQQPGGYPYQYVPEVTDEEPKKGVGMCIASFVLGLVSMFCCTSVFIPYIQIAGIIMSFILPTLGTIFGIIGTAKCKTKAKGLGIAGLIISGVMIIMLIITLITGISTIGTHYNIYYR